MSDDDDVTRLADVAMRKLTNAAVDDGDISENEAIALEERLRKNTAARKDKERAEHWIKTHVLKSLKFWVIMALSGSGITAYITNIFKLGE